MSKDGRGWFLALTGGVLLAFLSGIAQGSRAKSKNDTWSEKELAQYVSKGSTAGKLSKTSPEVLEYVIKLLS